MGLKCDKCSEYYHSLTDDGCIECDSCVRTLRRKSATLESQLTRVDEFVGIAKGLQAADILDLFALQELVNMLQSNCNITLAELLKSQMNLSGLSDKINITHVDLTDLKELVCILYF